MLENGLNRKRGMTLVGNDLWRKFETFQKLKIECYTNCATLGSLVPRLGGWWFCTRSGGFIFSIKGGFEAPLPPIERDETSKEVVFH